MSYKKEIIKVNNRNIEIIRVNELWYINKGKDCIRTGVYAGYQSKERLIQAIKEGLNKRG